MRFSIRAASSWFLSGIAALVVVQGCRFAPLPDPNDPKDVGVLAPEVLRRKLKWASENLNERVAKGEIDEDQAQEMISSYADDLIKSAPIEQIDVDRAWEYGEVFRTARRWDMARAVLTVAVKNAKGEDRRVNDSLRLAHVMAMQGDTDEALDMAESVLNAKPNDSAPILPAVLLEIVPAAENKGQDERLARLLEKAIDKHNTTIVDPKLPAGEAFLTAKPYHIRRAWSKVIVLYRRAGNETEADAAVQRMTRMMSGIAVL